MSYKPGPLYDAAIHVGKIGTYFHDLALSIQRVWLLGPYLYRFFWWIYIAAYSAAHWLATADRRFDWGELNRIFTAPGMWILVKCGADIGRAGYYQYWPWGWFIWKFRKEHPILDALLSYDFRWIGNYVLNRWPVIGAISRNPSLWVWRRLKARWPDLAQIVNSPGMWILVKCGADIGRAGYYQYWPWGWFIWKFRKEHPPLDALLDRDTRWLFFWFQEMIDRYLAAYTPWLVRTCERLLNKIWQMRL